MVAFTCQFDSTTDSAPAGFRNCVISACQWIGSRLANNLTVPVKIKWADLGAGVGASTTITSSTAYPTVAWGVLYNALVAKATSAADQLAIANLSSTAPTGYQTLFISECAHEALGLSSGGDLSGTITINSNASLTWCTDNSNGVPAGQYDLFGVVLHEVTELLGRSSNQGGGGRSLLFLWRYASPHTRQWNPTLSGYFSLDDGVTNLGTFNGSGSGDDTDWTSGGVPVANDCVGPATTGVVLPFSSVDLMMMDIMGYDMAPAAMAAASRTIVYTNRHKLKLIAPKRLILPAAVVPPAAVSGAGRTALFYYTNRGLRWSVLRRMRHPLILGGTVPSPPPPPPPPPPPLVAPGLGGRPLHDPGYWKRRHEQDERERLEREAAEAAEEKARAEYHAALRQIVETGEAPKTPEQILAARTAWLQAETEAEEAAIVFLLLA